MRRGLIHFTGEDVEAAGVSAAAGFQTGLQCRVTYGKDSGWVDIFWESSVWGWRQRLRHLHELENDGGNVRMPAVIILAYKTLGKTGTAAVFGGLGRLLMVYGTSKLVSKKPDEKRSRRRLPEPGRS